MPTPLTNEARQAIAQALRKHSRTTPALLEVQSTFPEVTRAHVTQVADELGIPGASIMQTYPRVPSPPTVTEEEWISADGDDPDDGPPPTKH